MQDESQAAFQPESPVTSEQMHDAGVGLVAVAAASPHPRAVTAPTSMVVLLQTATGTRSPRIPLVTASPLETFPSNSLVEGSGNRRRQRLTEEQLAKKKLTDRESQRRRIGKMQTLQSENVAKNIQLRVSNRRYVV